MSIRRESQRALADAALQANLTSTLSKTLHSRHEAVAEVENWEALRQYAHDVKRHTLDHLAYYLEQFEANVTRRRGHVFWARTPREANEYIIDLLHQRQIQKVVKSKTMVGEEIGLNEALAAARVQVVETDLGEYIIQLADQKPSHIIAPALHLSKEQVSQIFEKKLGLRLGTDVEAITAAARRLLRKEFLSAGMGITGVNFGIAETGTVVVVENEGNARLTLSSPRIHLAVMGIEKLLPRLADLPVFLKLLTRSATGQSMTSYIDLVQGASAAGEVSGPREFHLVLIDNGRSRILQDPHLRQTLYCIRCGACQNVCPVYQSIGGHAYQTTYQGPIGAILSPQLASGPKASRHPFASSLCGACVEVCPVKIQIPEVLLRLRHQIQEGHSQRAARLPFEHWGFQLWSWVMRSGERFQAAIRWRRRLGRLPWSRRLSAFLPPLSRWAQDRTAPRPAARSFREEMSQVQRKNP